MTNIITGITGFVGSNLNLYLKNNGCHVKGLSRQPNNEENIISYEQLSKAYLTGTESFVHLAGKAHDLKKTSEDKEYFSVNTDLTIKLYDMFLESDCSVFIFLSSVKAAADKLNSHLTEDYDPNPITAYGKSKLKAEQYILSKPIPDTKKVYILRACMIHGPKNKGNLNLLYNIVKKGIPMPLGKFKNKRSFLSVDNLCFVIKKLIEAKPKSGIYNVSDDDYLSTKQLIILIGETIGKKAIILDMPKWAVNTIAFLGNYIPIPINTERLKKLTENYCVSNKKVKTAIHSPLPLSANQGFIKTINSFRN